MNEPDNRAGRSARLAVPCLAPSPRGEVLPFPRHREVGFVERHAYRLATMRHPKGEQHVARLMQVQRDTLERRGIAPERIKTEVAALEGRIRAAAWQFMTADDGGAA